MEQAKFYKYAAIFLVILNLSMVAFFLITRPKPEHGGKHHARNVLKLDAAQNDTFQQYANTHKDLMKDLDEEQKQLLKTYFQTLTNPTNIGMTDSLLTQVQSLERQKIVSTYEHLKEVKVMLNEEQQPLFQDFMNHIYGRILLESRKR